LARDDHEFAKLAKSLENTGDPLRAIVYSAAVLIVVVLLAAVLERAQLLETNMLTQERVSLDAYIDGTVSRPFAYRILLPQILRGIDAVTPASAAADLDRLGARIGWTGPQNKYPRDVIWLAVLQFASLIGYALIGASLYSALRKQEKSWRQWIVAPVLLLFLVPIVYKGLGHIYDFTSLFFMVWLLWAMADRRQALYLLVFAASCLNKETTLLMSVAYAAVFFRRMVFGRYVVMLAAQFAIFLAIYVPLRVTYKDNPGSGIQVHWNEQFTYYASHLNNGYVLAIFCMSVVLFVILITFRWNEKPQLLRRAAVMIVPHMALLFYGAAPGEVRNLYEIVPLVSMLILCSVASICSSACYGRVLESER
jgi:hypothetical protein